MERLKSVSLNSRNGVFVIKVILILMSVLVFLMSLPHPVCGQVHYHGFEKRRSGWFRRFAFPKRTTLNIAPSLTIPTVNDPAAAITSFAQISFPFTIHFDSVSPIFDTIADVIYPGPGINFLRRKKREVEHKTDSHDYGNKTNNIFVTGLPHPGGERAVLLPILMIALGGIGFSEKPCLHRAVCEIHEDSLKGYGLLGEIIVLIFSFSKSRFASTKNLKDLVEAERMGKGNNCYKYMEHCKTSIFKWHRN